MLVGQQRTEWFPVEAGVRQVVSSPPLFVIFIDGLVGAVKRAQVNSALEGVKFNILLFADDVVLIADSRKDLQKLLDTVYEYSQRGASYGTRLKARSFASVRERLINSNIFLA